ncbi:MAG TPA: hypothetical protein VN792_01545 [Candidatus Acidoferrales bacterium]|nr:hypothetical protein [Candidatus Acidoferrales bacterium]
MTTTTPQSQKIGEIVELAGVGALITGGILSIHHYLIAAFFLGGAAAIYIGQKLRGQ